MKRTWNEANHLPPRQNQLRGRGQGQSQGQSLNQPQTQPQIQNQGPGPGSGPSQREAQARGQSQTQDLVYVDVPSVHATSPAAQAQVGDGSSRNLTTSGGSSGSSASSSMPMSMPSALPPGPSAASGMSPPITRPLRSVSSPGRPNPPLQLQSQLQPPMPIPPASGTAAGEQVPMITRKVKACVACRKQKIKCDMEGDQPPCTRCVRRGLSCVINKSLQSLIDTSAQTQTLHSDVLNIFETLVEVCNHLDLPAPQPLQTRIGGDGDGAKSSHDFQQDAAYEHDSAVYAASRPMSPSDMEAPVNAFLDVPEERGPSSQSITGSIHASTPSHKGNPDPDLISSGIISLEVGEMLARRYLDKLDHYLYGIGSAYADLKSLRSSPILLAAVCTISALHDKDSPRVYEACSYEFQRLVSKSLFENRGVEYLRALCIASYWLSDASRILNSNALMRAADVRLPKYFYQVTMADAAGAQDGGDLSMSAKVDRVRLWYLLYICDQHLSILYNRDPIIYRNQDIILGWEAFLELEMTGDQDVRIASQVALLHLMSEIRTVLGSESAEPLPKALTTASNNYNRQIDQWYSRFSPSFKPNPHIGDFPHKGLNLHYHFAKLYLGHHVFRGLNGGPIPPYFLPAAMMAHSAAISIFELVLEDSALLDSLVGVPFYFHVMMSFAGQFMLSCSPYSGQLCLDEAKNLALMTKVITTFTSIPCLSIHPLRKMTAALEKRLAQSNALHARAMSVNEAMAGSTRSELVHSSNDALWGDMQGNDHLILERGEPEKSLIDYRMGYAETVSNMVRQGNNSAYMSDSANVSGSFMMGPPTNASNLSSDTIFQDFGGFDFPNLHMNFPSGS